MHDIRVVRADPAAFDAAMERRGVPPIAAEVVRVDDLRRSAEQASQAAQATLNQLAKQIGTAIKRGDTTLANELKVQTAAPNDVVAAQGKAAEGAKGRRDSLLAALPNILDPDVPEGRDEA